MKWKVGGGKRERNEGKGVEKPEEKGWEIIGECVEEKKRKGMRGGKGRGT